MKQLNIFELHNSINKKKNLRQTIYHKILEKCHIKIKASAGKEFYECNYDVPHYVVGLPLFNINECIDYLINKLKDNGFKVDYFFPKTLHISWFPVSEIKNEETNRNDSSSMLMNYIPYKNEKGKFTLNVD
jgi:hypothetical protein